MAAPVHTLPMDAVKALMPAISQMPPKSECLDLGALPQASGKTTPLQCFKKDVESDMKQEHPAGQVET